jgi:2-polyprenyl-3-methyl-5-hydroxy-6-metoxy-1,4-benzoquinol methylase
MNGHKLTNCLACDGNNLSDVLNFGLQPLANSYREIGQLDETEPKYPLGLNVCTHCFHLQLPYAVNPDLMFKDYKYVSGTSQTLKDYFKWFSRFSCEYYERHTGNYVYKVLDIACNDGTQLDTFKQLGIDTYGVDPAENLYDISSKKGHTIINEYLNRNVVDHYRKNGIWFNIINAQNVFAHNSNPAEFLNCCKDLMTPNSLLFIQNSQANMIKNGEFDTIYHEHQSFWNLNSMCQVAHRAGLYVIDRIRTPIHGVSDLFVLSKRPRTQWLYNALDMERNEGLYESKTYDTYRQKTNDIIVNFKVAVEKFRNKIPLVGYGAAAKGMTLLNVSNVDLDCIIDDNPLKQGLWTPGRDIPIMSRGQFISRYKDQPAIGFVPLAWNFFGEIKTKIYQMRPIITHRDIFLQYFPKVEWV